MKRLGRRLLAAGLFLSLPVCLTPVSDSDLPWHLSAGRFIAAHGRVPRADFLSWTKAGSPWTDFEWGAELLFYGLERLGGAPALWLFKAAVFAGVLGLFVLLLRSWDLPEAWAAASLFPLILSLVPFLDIRPEIFSFFLTLAQLLVLESLRAGTIRVRGRTLLLLHSGAYAVWANLHAGFLVGLALCALYGAAPYVPPGLRESHETRDRVPGLGLALAGLAGSLLNPYGLGVLAVVAEHWNQREALRSLISEWTAPTLLNSYQRTYWALLVFSYLGFIRAFLRGRRPPAAHVLILVAVSLFASRTYRTTAYVSLILFPLSLRAWHSLDAPPWWKRARPAAAALLLAGLVPTAWRVLSLEGLFRGVKETRAHEPAAVCDFLRREKEELAPLKLFNTWNWGGYLGWSLYPDYKVFMDGRYLFTELLSEVHAAERDSDAWRSFLDSRGVQLAVLPVARPKVKLPFALATWRPIDISFMPRGEWALVYWDGQALVRVRRDAVRKEWLARHEYRVLDPNDLQYLSQRVAAGSLSRTELEGEVRRFLSETSDSGEAARLSAWFEELGRETVAPR